MNSSNEKEILKLASTPFEYKAEDIYVGGRVIVYYGSMPNKDLEVLEVREKTNASFTVIDDKKERHTFLLSTGIRYGATTHRYHDRSYPMNDYNTPIYNASVLRKEYYEKRKKMYYTARQALSTIQVKLTNSFHKVNNLALEELVEEIDKLAAWTTYHEQTPLPPDDERGMEDMS